MAAADYVVASSVPAYVVAALGAGVAVWVLVLRPRSTVHRALAGFLLVRAISHAAIGLSDAAPTFTAASAFFEVSGAAITMSLVPLAVFVLHTPGPRAGRALRRGVVTLAALVAAGGVGASLVSTTPSLLLATENGWAAKARFLGAYTGLAGIPLAAWVLSRDLGRDEGGRSLWLIVLGLTLYPLFRATRSALQVEQVWSEGAPFTVAVTAEAFLLVLSFSALLAALNLARHRPWASGPPIGLLALYTGAIALGYATWTGQVPRSTSVATVDVLFPALIVYGVLRHELFGLDVKVRFAVRQSTVAAAFIAAFFVVSEGAASFFESSSNSAFLGIAAAGLLVFALAPLQRLAERVAASAVPDVPGALPAASDERHALFRDAVALALRDGTIDRDEERDLLRMAGRLGLSNEEAFTLIDGVEAGRTPSS